jgi:hypothetical protein
MVFDNETRRYKRETKKNENWKVNVSQVMHSRIRLKFSFEMIALVGQVLL